MRKCEGAASVPVRAQGEEGAHSGARCSGDLGRGWGQQSPGSLQGNLTPFHGSPESWYDGNAIETLDGLLSRPLRPFTRDFEFKWREWFLSWKKKKGEEIHWALGVMGRVCGYGWKPGEVCRLCPFFSQQTQSVCPGPGTQPDLPAEVCVWNLSSGREGDNPGARTRVLWGD